MLIPLPPKSHRKRPGKPRVAPAPAPAAPRVLDVSVNEGDGSLRVTFDQPVTWDGVGPGTLSTSTGGGQWANQLAPDLLRMEPNCGTIFTFGATWSWDAPDTSLS